MFSATNPGNANANNYRPLQATAILTSPPTTFTATTTPCRWRGPPPWRPLHHPGKLHVAKSPWHYQSRDQPQFNLQANYGALQSDRRNLFNAAYSIDLGNRVHVNAFFVNGALERLAVLRTHADAKSGANLTFGGNYTPNNPPNSNFNMSSNLGVATKPRKPPPVSPVRSPQAIIPCSISVANPTGIAINNQSILGTNAQQLNPLVTLQL